MHFARRLLRWLLFLGVFSALGAGVFSYVRSQPRCSFTAPDWVAALSADHSRLLTYKSHAGRGSTWNVWDLETGESLFEWPSEFDQSWALTSDHRLVASSLEGQSLQMLDWQAGQRWMLDEPLGVTNLSGIDFSSKDRWLLVRVGEEKPNLLMDVASRKVVMRGMSGRWSVSTDERLLFEHKGPDDDLTIWDLAENKSRGTLPLNSRWWQISPDDRLVIERHGDEDGGINDYFDAWDVTTLKRRFHHKFPHEGRWCVQFSRDGRRMAAWLKETDRVSNLELIETETGKVLWARPMRVGEACTFTPDGSLVHLVHCGIDGLPGVSMFDAATGKVLWQRPYWGKTYFTPSAEIVVHQDESDGPLWLVDARTGKKKARLPLQFFGENLTPTPDGRYFVVHGTRPRSPEAGGLKKWLENFWPWGMTDEAPCVIVMETLTGREIFHGVNCGKTSATLSFDGSTLVTAEGPGAGMHGEALIRVWDVHSTKAWLWAIGVGTSAAFLWQIVLIGAVRVFRPGSRSGNSKNE